jgi:hypothetical protein
MKLPLSLGWSPIEMKNLKFVTVIPKIFIDLEGLLADCLNLPPFPLSIRFHLPSLADTQAVQ